MSKFDKEMKNQIEIETQNIELSNRVYANIEKAFEEKKQKKKQIFFFDKKFVFSTMSIILVALLTVAGLIIFKDKNKRMPYFYNISEKSEYITIKLEEISDYTNKAVIVPEIDGYIIDSNIRMVFSQKKSCAVSINYSGENGALVYIWIVFAENVEYENVKFDLLETEEEINGVKVFYNKALISNKVEINAKYIKDDAKYYIRYIGDEDIFLQDII
mgnify:CR=1 FL=1|jgi:hypothetical protein